MDEILQIIGAVLILGAFAAAQVGRLDQKSVPYLVVNIVGAGLLAVLAWHGREWGFLLLEGVWTLVSALSLIGVLAAQRRKPDGETARAG